MTRLSSLLMAAQAGPEEEECAAPHPDPGACPSGQVVEWAGLSGAFGGPGL